MRVTIEIYPHDFYAVVRFQSAASVNTACNSEMELCIDGFPLRVDQPGDSSDESSEESSDESIEDAFNETRLYLGNIPTDVDEDELRHMFSGFGRIIELKITKRGGNRAQYYGFITYQNVKSAYNLLKSSRNRDFLHQGNVLKIKRVK